MKADKYYEEAYRLHCTYPVADSHYDLPVELMYRRNMGEKEIIKTEYLPVWKRAGINLLILSVFVENEYVPELSLKVALKQIAAVKREIEESEGEVVLITDKDKLHKVTVNKDKVGILLFLEGLECLIGDLEILELFYELGVRGAALCWSRRNPFATGSATASSTLQQEGKITDKGWNAIIQMKNRGMFLDVSHLNDDGINELLTSDVFNASFFPVATHSNARAIYRSYRNLTDKQLVNIGKLGGYVGLNSNVYLVGAKGWEKLYLHLEYLLAMVGKRNIGMGMDLYDNCNRYMRNTARLKKEDVIAGHDKWMEWTAFLLRKGMEKEIVTGIMGRNLIEMLRVILA